MLLLALLVLNKSRFRGTLLGMLKIRQVAACIFMLSIPSSKATKWQHFQSHTVSYPCLNFSFQILFKGIKECGVKVILILVG